MIDAAGDKAVAGVIARFDFDKVHRAMVAVEWNDKAPSLASLKETARILLTQAWLLKGTAEACGFSAWFKSSDVDSLGLMFCLAWANVEVSA